MNETTVYLVYDQDGARFVYGGEDAAEYERRCAELAGGYAGSLLGKRRVGREQWIVRAYFREQPDATFIARRRDGFPYGLSWEPAGQPADEAAD